MSFLNSIFGGKPDVPDLPKLDLGTEQQLAIKNNAAALPAAQDLAAKTNLFSREQIDQMLASAIPDFAAIRGNISGNLRSLTAGELPSDVSDRVQNSAAARSLGGGFAGSGMSRDLVARDLGLTSLDLTQKGLSDAESWMKTTDSIYAPSMMNVTSMFVSPGQQAQFDVSEREAQFQRQWMQNQIKAMPDPVTVGLWNTAWSVVDAVLTAETGQSVDLGRVNPKGNFGGVGGQGVGDTGMSGGSSGSGGDMGFGGSAGGGDYGAGFGGGFGGMA